MATATTDRTARDTVVGVFHSHAEAQKAVRDLKAAGFDDDQIGVASRDREGTFAEQNEETMAEEGAVAGAATGLGAGALWGLGIVAGALPAIGPVIAGGALAAVAASAAGTAAAGGLIGALVGWGIPEDEANYYHGEFEEGRTIVTVKCGKARWEEAHRILDNANAYDYHRRETEHATDATAAQRQSYDGKMVAREEVLDVDKHTEVAGQARVRKEVHTDTAHVEVPVKREELVVERTPLRGEDAGAITGANEEERITLREEEVDVNKRTVAKEAVAVGKRTVTETESVDADLKEEEIVVEGAAETGGGTATATRATTRTAKSRAGVTGQVDPGTGEDQSRPDRPR
ncbi:DUF2382 domain-containing protein [Alienimonas californiensis]|uniref:Stress response protein YsnF n=1 Tax=Alienimonas californiensis TaxID=2527989 RepID=A0A517P3S3_9PLAN|nr:DUF2382 domain-containing protein [Alienimonas californiensis]QDT14018.1 Stress response protein YsnF [Alienimonas californiensis]